MEYFNGVKYVKINGVYRQYSYYQLKSLILNKKPKKDKEQFIGFIKMNKKIEKCTKRNFFRDLDWRMVEEKNFVFDNLEKDPLAIENGAKDDQGEIIAETGQDKKVFVQDKMILSGTSKLSGYRRKKRPIFLFQDQINLAGKKYFCPARGAKCHGKFLRDNMKLITKPAIRRLARRGGVNGLIYDETRIEIGEDKTNDETRTPPSDKSLPELSDHHQSGNDKKSDDQTSEVMTTIYSDISELEKIIGETVSEKEAKNDEEKQTQFDQTPKSLPEPRYGNGNDQTPNDETEAIEIENDQDDRDQEIGNGNGNDQTPSYKSLDVNYCVINKSKLQRLRKIEKEYISLTQGKENTRGEKIIAEKTNRSQEKAKVKKWKCPVCGKTMKDIVSAINQHSRIHIEEAKLECNFSGCKYKTNRPNILKQHKKNNHETKKKCKVCSKNFPNRKDLQEHTKVHTTTICPVCDKKFPSKSNMTKHVTSVHQEKKFTCKECNKQYCNNQTLKFHINRHHSNDQP